VLSFISHADRRVRRAAVRGILRITEEKKEKAQAAAKPRLGAHLDVSREMFRAKTQADADALGRVVGDAVGKVEVRGGTSEAACADVC
jgi:hypothetical protein